MLILQLARKKFIMTNALEQKIMHVILMVDIIYTQYYILCQIRALISYFQ
jgi:hypothetical protein